MSRNRLDTETSPYLLQHKDNPVHWYAWGREALGTAKRENRPILLSIGYAACHWCHVMAHESLEDDATAAVMNELFVNIKVDREERPDIDTIYMTALHMMGEQGGWPLTMFLTPEGEPFFGGTYFPKEPNYGRQGFVHVLKQISRIYHDQPEKIRANAAALKQALAKLGSSPGEAALDLQALDAIADRLLGAVDKDHGGVGGAPKFPQTGILELLWRAHLRTGNAAARDAVSLTLDHMCQGGLYDHLGGGFARYTVDEQWLVPHFEKMLYDNALIMELLTLVWQETKNPLYAERVAETADWVLREMIAGSGAFAASLDADSEGEEGKFYVWNEADIDAALLPGEAPLFKDVYGVTAEGNWEGKTILNRLGALARRPDAEEAKLAAAREALLKIRSRRVRPGWDDKVLVNWNGLMIRAFAKAGAAFDRADWIRAAEAAFEGICANMTDGDRLYHTARLGRPQHRAMADGYANMADAALSLYEITGNGACLDRARAWVQTLDTHYWDGEAGGYYFTADDAEALITRTKTAIDDAVPSANGTLVSVLTKLYHLTGEEMYQARAQDLVKAFAGEVQRNFFPLATYLNGFEFSQKPLQIVLAGGRNEDAVKAFLAAVHGTSLPDRVLFVAAEDAALPPGHPAAGKGRVSGKPAAYLCVGPQCSAPITAPGDLEKALSALRAGGASA